MKIEHDIALKELPALKVSDDMGSVVLSSGRTIAETNAGSALIVEKLYRDAFARGIAMFYRDERSVKSNEFIRANPDGSEDLVILDVDNRSYTLLKHLVPAGQGQLASCIK